VAEVATAEDFPVSWSDPADALVYWTRDVMHNPHQMTPLDFDIAAASITAGRVKAMAEYWGHPMTPAIRRVNTYRYDAMLPAVHPAEIGARMALVERRTLSMAHRPAVIWAEWQPEIEFHLARWAAFDLAGADDEALLAHLDDSLLRLKRAYFIHFVIAWPALIAMDQFNFLHAELFPGASPLASLVLTQGENNKTVETGRELWKLSRLLDGPDFPAALERFLHSYGHRADALTLTEPSWIEDPASVLAQVRAFAANPERDPVREREVQLAERDAATREARERLAGYPFRVRDLFETSLRCAREATAVWENHNFYIDAWCEDEMRQVVREVARRAVRAGGIDAVADAPMLRLEELRAAVRGVDQRERVAAETASHRRFARIVPPHALGPEPKGVPPGLLAQAARSFFGVPPPPAEAGLVRGAPASAGVVRGIARVRHRLEEARDLQLGEILVVPSTTQAWTPLFALAAAVVSDSGGVLCHCALVAREYGIAAVVGTGRGTQLIPDGSLVEVDGEAGTVRLLPT